MNKRSVFVLLAPFLAALSVAATFFITVRTVSAWMDPVTGARKVETSIAWGLSTETTIEEPAMFKRLRELRPDYQANWRFTSRTPYDIWGRPQLFACGSLPRTVEFRPLLDAWSRVATDEEFLRSIDLLASDDPRQFDEAVQTMANRLDY